MTLMMAEIAADRSMLTICNAGHNPGYLVRKHGTIVDLDAGGIMLGVMEMFPFIQMEYSLEPGDLLAFYTDGIPEAEIGFEDMFGYDRLQYFLSENRDRPLPDIAQMLFQRVTSDTVPVGDDMAIVLVRVALGSGSKQTAEERGKAVA
ncbi:MAG: serine/threonine-protein phosphatase [bacterium]|nr:serine/threonine-protein phosphatase [bacterium]